MHKRFVEKMKSRAIATTIHPDEGSGAVDSGCADDITGPLVPVIRTRTGTLELNLDSVIIEFSIRAWGPGQRSGWLLALPLPAPTL